MIENIEITIQGLSGKGFKLVIVEIFQKNMVKSRINPVFSRVWGLFINDNFSPDGVEKSVAFATLSHL